MGLPKNLFLNQNQTAKVAMKTLDSNGHGVVFVTKAKNTLSGVLTPGDIRRAIDVGLDINAKLSSFMNTKPLLLDEGTGPKEATEILFEELQKKEKEVKEEISVIKIPVVNKKQQVTDIATFIQNNKELSLTFGINGNHTDTGIQRVLIVGGAGYLGSILSRLLLEKGYKVRVLDSLLFGKRPVQSLQSNPNFELIKGDVRDIQMIHKCLNGTDAVVHLAAIVGDPASKKYPQDTIGVNYLATMTLALACKYYQINKFIFASTCSVYGVGNETLDETADLNPVSLYARTKIESEKGILSLADENFRPVIMRMSTLYGLSPRMRFDLVVNTFAKMLTTEGKISIFGGEQWRPFLHVADAAAAYVLVLEKSLSHLSNLTFNVGTNSQNHQIIELGEFVKQVKPKTKVEVKTNEIDVINDTRTYKVSFDKIETELGFTAERTIAESMAEISEAIDSGKIKNPANQQYYNATQ